MKTFLKIEALPSLSKNVTRDKPTISPYSGGVTKTHFEAFVQKEARTLRLQEIKMATLNPGRSGLTALGTDAILYWRLWHIATALQERGIHICAVPAARWPPGAKLPDGYPYSFLGDSTLDWAGVGLLVATELEESVQHISDVGGSRRHWFVIVDATADEAPPLVFCAMGPAPGGDVDTWMGILNDYKTLQCRFRNSRFVLAGDANVHFKCIVDHIAGCTCLHCHQCKADKVIEEAVNAAGLIVCNPDIPTHVSGTILDVFLTPRTSPTEVEVDAENVGSSDHSLVTSSVRAAVNLNFVSGLGRVALAGIEEWNEALQVVSPLLNATARAAELATVDLAECGNKIRWRRRRVIVDTAAWLRDCIYVLAGHLLGATRVYRPREQTSGVAPLTPSLKPVNFGTYEEYQEAVQAAVWRAQSDTALRYSRLRQRNPGAAESLIASYFKRARHFTVALTDGDTGALLGPASSVDAVVTDLVKRADNDFPQDPLQAAWAQRCVEQIRRQGAPDAGVSEIRPLGSVTSARNKSLYSESEVQAAIESLKVDKKLHMFATQQSRLTPLLVGA